MAELDNLPEHVGTERLLWLLHGLEEEGRGLCLQWVMD